MGRRQLRQVPIMPSQWESGLLGMVLERDKQKQQAAFFFPDLKAGGEVRWRKQGGRDNLPFLEATRNTALEVRWHEAKPQC